MHVRLSISTGLATMALLSLALVVANSRARTASATLDLVQACSAADNTGDGVIDLRDMQAEAAHYAQSIGDPLYDVRFDVWSWNPLTGSTVGPDGDIGTPDIQLVFSRFGFTCAPNWETLGGSYANDPPCAGGTGDPIGTILLMPFTFVWPAPSALQRFNDSLSNIGMTSGYNFLWTTRDNFKDGGGCAEGAITRATNKGWSTVLSCFPALICTDSRWHTRCEVHYAWWAGNWASCTPHWDSAPPDSNHAPGYYSITNPVGKHYVPAVYNGTDNYTGSGYDAARDWLWYQLIRQYGIGTDVGQQYFSNTFDRIQCYGPASHADGKVNIILLR